MLSMKISKICLQVFFMWGQVLSNVLKSMFISDLLIIISFKIHLRYMSMLIAPKCISSH